VAGHLRDDALSVVTQFDTHQRSQHRKRPGL